MSMLNQTTRVTLVLSIPRKYNDRRSHWNGFQMMMELPAWFAALEARGRREDSSSVVVVHWIDHDYGT
jgi:hypothetical protein